MTLLGVGFAESSEVRLDPSRVEACAEQNARSIGSPEIVMVSDQATTSRHRSTARPTGMS